MKLSIIIVNYNSGPLTKACIESVVKRRLGFGYEIIVVDNDSRDESVSMLRDEFPEIVVVDHGQNGGFGSGVNRGLEEATGDYYLILNPDIIVLPGAIENMLSYMEKHGDIGVLGAKLIYPNGKLQHSSFRFYTPMTIVYRRTWLGSLPIGKKAVDSFLMSDFDHKEPKDVDWLMGSCLMLRAEAVAKVGGMDERFFMYYEETDFLRRALAGGYRLLYVPEADAR